MLALTAIIAYLWISPFLTPTLIQTIRRDSMLGVGYQFTQQLMIADLLVLAGAFGIWWLTRRLDAVLRFSLLFACVFFAIPALSHFAGIAVLPQPQRYHLEMELGISLAAVFAARYLPSRVRMGLTVVLLLVLAAQFRGICPLRPRLDPTHRRHPDDRVQDHALAGSESSRSESHGLRRCRRLVQRLLRQSATQRRRRPFSPNWMLEIAVYAIYATDDPKASIAWLKAYGCHAITIPGPNSRESYHPYKNPHKFDGVLPVLWHEEDDTIFAVPQRSKSLAHVVPDAAVVRRAPIHGLDTADVERFVAALEDTTLPIADFDWKDTEHARINTSVRAGQSVAVQITYDPGWVAQANGNPARITRDGIGLLTIHPDCAGPCEIELSWDGGLERRVCRSLSVLVMLGVAFVALVRHIP